jgi:hypothetical protein
MRIDSPFRVCALALGITSLLLLALGLAMRLSVLPAVPLFEWDTRGWLEPALRWVGGSAFRESCEREWLYAAFLAACLRLGGGFETIVWVQWVCGLGGGLVLLLTWQMWSSMLPDRWTIQAPAALCGILALAAYILNPNLIAFEMSLRPEAVLGVVVLAACCCATGFSRARWHTRDQRMMLLWGIPLPVLAGAVVTLKPSWALSMPVLVAPLLLALAGPREGLVSRLLPLVGGTVAACVLLVLPERMLFVKDMQARVVLPMTLLTIHADAVLPALVAERADPSTSAERRDLLDFAIPRLEADLEASRQVPIHYHRLGFDPDYIMYRATLFPSLEHGRGMSKADIAAFCNDAFLETWKREPARMVAKVRQQLAYFAFPDGRTYSKQKIVLGDLTRGSIEVAGAPLDDSYAPEVRAMWEQYLAALGKAAPDPRTVRAWRPLDRLLREHLPPALLFALVSLVGATAAWAWKPLSHLRLPATLAVFYFAVPFANALTVAMVHALDNNRYRMSYGNILFFAMCAAVVLAVAILASAFQKHGENP